MFVMEVYYTRQGGGPAGRPSFAALPSANVVGRARRTALIPSAVSAIPMSSAAVLAAANLPAAPAATPEGEID